MELTNKVVKRYMTRGKMVMLLEIDHNDEIMYCFRINDKCNKKDYYSDKYPTIDSCEKASYRVTKGI